MGTKRIVRATVACFIATMLVVGFTAAPVAAADGTGISFGGDGISIDIGDDVSVDADTEDGVNVEEDVDEGETDPDGGTPDVDPTQVDTEENDSEGGPFPEEVCTDVTGEVHDSAPYEQVPWFDDLPEEAQPPGVPTTVITPEAVAGIVFGVTPNQCEIQDPNDPTYDPREDDVNPDGGAEVSRFTEWEDGYVTVVRYGVTLNDSNEDGPGVSGVTGVLVTSEFGDANPRVAVQDGEKEYAVDPRVRYWDGGNSSYAKNDVWLLGSKLGVNVECDGEECQPGTSGLPHYADYPALPDPVGGGGGGGDGICTDVTGQVHENAPYEQVPWFDDLPEEAQPPGVPTTVITPEAVAGIVFGVTPNQCEVQDPNDPTYDPREDDVDPAVNHEVSRFTEWEDGYVTVVRYGVTLNDSNEDGPGVSGVTGVLVTSEFGDANPRIAVQDGEKEYAVDPRVRYWEGGETAYAKNDVWLLGSKLGLNVECDGEECQPGTGGLPHYADYPSIPAPTGGDGGGGGDGGDGENNPPYDPREDDVDPDGGAEVSRFTEWEDGYVTVVRYGVTLNDSNEDGPGVSGVTGVLVTSEFGDVNHEIVVQDGEKEYAVDPRVRYWEGGETMYAKNDVRLLGSRLGVNVNCDGEECQPGTEGLPGFVDYPSIPAPTGGD